jgi:hypothetical protein
MFEKPGENPEIKTEEEIKDKPEQGPDFDREAEKEHRKEVRKLLVKELSGTLKQEGLTKIGNSLWQRKIGDFLHLVYLQRSQFSHQYYIEAGICNEKDIPEGEKPHIAYCKHQKRERIEYIVEKTENERLPESEDKEQKIKEKMDTVKAALDFEISGGLEKYPDDYYFPSVSMEEAKEKIDTIQKTVGEYIPLWFEKHSKPQ